jgi:hypothetical protein
MEEDERPGEVAAYFDGLDPDILPVAVGDRVLRAVTLDESANEIVGSRFRFNKPFSVI